MKLKKRQSKNVLEDPSIGGPGMTWKQAKEHIRNTAQWYWKTKHPPSKLPVAQSWKAGMDNPFKKALKK